MTKILLCILLVIGAQSLSAATSSAAAGTGGSGIAQHVSQVLDKGLGLLAGCSAAFVALYWVYISLGLAFNMAKPDDFSHFILGTIFIFGAQSLAGLYLLVFQG